MGDKIRKTLEKNLHYIAVTDDVWLIFFMPRKLTLYITTTRLIDLTPAKQ